MPRTIKLHDELDRWRYVCPRGHREWEPTNGHYWCAGCARAAAANDDVDPAFAELRDRKTGDLLARNEVTLETEVGPYANLKTDAGV